MIKKIVFTIVFVSIISIIGCNQATSTPEPTQTHTARPTSTFTPPTVTPTRTPFPTPKTQAYPFPTQTPDPTAAAIFNDWNSKYLSGVSDFNPLYIPSHTDISPDRNWAAAELLDERKINVAEISGDKAWKLTCDTFSRLGWCDGVSIMKWSQDSRYLFFYPFIAAESYGTYETVSLARLDVRSGMVENLIDDSVASYPLYELEISPNEILLVYIGNRDSDELQVLDLETREQYQVNLSFKPGSISQVVWRDNTSVLFNMYYSGAALIVELNIETGEQRTIISDKDNRYRIIEVFDESKLFVNRLIPSGKASLVGNEYIYINIDSGEVTFVPTVTPPRE